MLEKRRTPASQFSARLRQAEGDLIETIDGSDVKVVSGGENPGKQVFVLRASAWGER
jgi:hypothetical protein